MGDIASSRRGSSHNQAPAAATLAPGSFPAQQSGQDVTRLYGAPTRRAGLSSYG